MAMMKSSNPVLSDKIFTREAVSDFSETMTITGTVNKTGMLLLLVVGAAFYTWTHPQQAVILMLPGAIIGLILGLVTAFKARIAPYTAPVYAIAQGLFLGGFSMMFETRYPGIVNQAVGLTFATFLAMLIVYWSRLIKVTENFKLGVAAATGGIAIFYLVSFVASLFGMKMSFLVSSSPLSIGISLFVVVIAALNLVMDFDFIENGAEKGAPKYMEWYGAFGLIVTLIWLYLEMLRLLSKLRSR